MDLSNVTSRRDANQLTRAYFDNLMVEPRYLDSVVPDLTTELFGHKFASPVTICAFSHLSGHHPGGMLEMARGAVKAGICNFAGMGSKEELSDILATGAGTVKIVKPYADRNRVKDMLKFAADHGAIAVGMDIDHSFGHTGYADVVLGDVMQPVTQDELYEFAHTTNLPFVVKGVLSVQDALKCKEAGVSALLISHHHGIVPYAVPPLMALPAIREAVGDDMDLIVDCCIESGTDVFKCLALGAKTICVGRAVLPAFQERGADGVADAVAKMHDELRAMMAWTCSPDTSHIANDVLWDASLHCKI